MSKLYNKQSDITSNFKDFFKENIPNIRKTQLNIIPAIIFGMIISSSSSANSIASVLKDEFSFIQYDSITKRIRRFFNNKLFNPYNFYNQFIKYIIKNYKKKHQDKRVHIVFDHMYSHDNYTVFSMSLRIGKQGIPIYFECFDGFNNPEAYFDSTIIKGINAVHDLFKNTDSELIFLADRWFNSENVLKYINDLGHTFCIRLKSTIKISVFDHKERHYINKYTSNLFAYQYHATYFYDCFLFENSDFKVNIALSKKSGVSEHWIIATNGDPKRAIKDYGYRFGAIETIFKNQKSNGFNIEKINNSTLKSFTTMYSLVCVAVTFLIILGADYSKNSSCYKKFKLETHKLRNNIKTRVMSLFKIGMLLFKRGYNSPVYIRIPFRFILYDV